MPPLPQNPPDLLQPCTLLRRRLLLVQPIDNGKLEIGKATSVLEGQESAAIGQRDDRQPAEPPNQFGPHENQTESTRKFDELD